MKKIIKRTVSTIVAAIVSTSLFLSVSAVSDQYTFPNGDTMYATLDVSSTSIESKTTIGIGYTAVAQIKAQYYVKGTTTVRNARDTKTGYNGGAIARVSNGGGTWISATSSNSAENGTYSHLITLNW